MMVKASSSSPASAYGAEPAERRRLGGPPHSADPRLQA
jgi:hypothetical protein